MRGLPTLVFAILLGLPITAAGADNATQFSGVPAVLPSGTLMIEGHEVTLWGIDPLARDQKCWQGNVAWDCGEQALTALRHYITGHAVRCEVKSGSSAQCFRKQSGKEDDIAGWLTSQGWARDKQGVSDGLYADAEEDARASRRGIWTSRFQTAEDWKNGIPHYVQYDPAPPKRAIPAGAQ
jgi:endonuclease YncB( thermonuclease family)